MDHQTDLHIHTIVSDGYKAPDMILEKAAEYGLARISITDHDAVGAYRNFDVDPFSLADSLGIELVTGIELDTDYNGAEVHLLGYGIDIDHPGLNAHLHRVQAQRRKRINLQAQKLHAYFKEALIDLDAIFRPERDTVMKPHLFRSLEKAKKVSSYQEFKALLKEHAAVNAPVVRPHLFEAIDLIRRAGGTAVLAHPGYLEKESFGMETAIRDAARHGLAGLETDYPYWKPNEKCDRQFPDAESAGVMIARIRSLARELGLFTTRGSDAHHTDAMKQFAQGAVPA